MNAHIDLVIGFAAGLVHVAAFGLYNRQMLRGESKPNTATWSLWSFMTVLNALTYFFMNRDWVKALLPSISTLACLATFVFALAKGKFSRPSRTNAVIFAIGLLSVLVWWLFRNAAPANMLLQIAFGISFLPTFLGVWKDPSTERPLPWFIWSSAYVLLIATIIMRWQGAWVDLVYPINGFTFHMIVGALSLRRQPSSLGS